MAIFTYQGQYFWAIEINMDSIKSLNEMLTEKFNVGQESGENLIKKYNLYFRNGNIIELDDLTEISRYASLEDIVKISVKFKKLERVVKITLGYISKKSNVHYYVRSDNEQWYHGTLIKVEKFLRNIKLRYSLFLEIPRGIKKFFFLILLAGLSVYVIIGILKRLLENSISSGPEILTAIIIPKIFIPVVALFPIWGIQCLFKYLFPGTIFMLSERQIRKNQDRKNLRRWIFQGVIGGTVLGVLAGLLLRFII